VTLLAAASSSTSAFDQPGTLGFLVVFGMAIILFFVFRSMSKQLRKVNDAARAEEAAAARAEAQATVTDAPSGGNGGPSAD
jgi:Na+-transporting methylmalonyl-CoA/oxaloacetate decarboxylase gamma subunit